MSKVDMSSQEVTANSVISRGILAALVSRGLAVLAPLLTVPMALQHLGASLYGAWSAALALTAVTAFADLGLGVGVMTRLAAATSDDDHERGRVMVSSAYVPVLTIATVLIVALWTSSLWVGWGRVVGGSGPETNTIVLITLTIFLVNVGGGLIVRIQYAVQQVALSNLWQACGSMAGIGAVFIAVWLDSSAPIFVILASGTPTLVALLNAATFFYRGRGRQIRPSLRYFSWGESRRLMRLGVRFSIITILLSVTMSTDSVIIANTVGLDAVPEYSITARIFGMLGAVVSALTIPLWTANVRALQSNNVSWVERMTRKMVVVSGVGVAALATAATILAPWVIEIWLSGSISPSLTLLMGFALVSVVQAVAAPFFMVQNAGEVLRPQTLGYALLLISLPVKWLVASNFGMQYVPWVTVLGYGGLILPLAVYGYRITLNQRRNNVGEQQ